MDPGFAKYNFEGRLLRSLSNLPEMLTDCNLAFLVPVEHTILHNNFQETQESTKLKNPEVQVSLT